MLNTKSLDALRALRREPKFAGNAIMTAEEKQAMTPLIDSMLDRLIDGIEANPNRSWVIAQVRPAIAEFYLEDTEVREPCVVYVMRVFETLGLVGSQGAFKDYMIEF